MAGLFVELRRRNVFRVGAAYLIVAWLVLQVAATAFPALHLPEWTVTFVTVLLIAGLPIALILAWAFELTPQGIKLTASASPRVGRAPGRTLDFLIIGLLVIAISGLVIDKYVLDGRHEPEASTPALQVGNTRSLAVLPFVNMSTDQEQEFFADGITEEILNTLAAIKELKVAGRTSSFQFKDTRKDLREIGNSLGVQNLLEGSVRKAGNQVRITAQLIEADTGFHLWSQTFDRNFSDVFTIQTDIARAVGAALQVELGISVEQSVARRTTSNLAAYSLYLQAMQYAQAQDIGSLRKALEMSKRVMEMEPDFLPGYVAYGSSVIWLFAWGIDLTETSLAEVERLMQQIVSRDPHFAHAWAVLAYSYMYRYQWTKAEAAFAEAIRLDPDLVAANEEWAYALFVLLGRPADAIELMKRVIAIEPLSLFTRGTYAQALAALGRWNEAEAEFRQLLELDPDYGMTYYLIAATYNLRLGRMADAMPWYRKAMQLDPDAVYILPEVSMTLQDMGAGEDAKIARMQLDALGWESHLITVFRYNLARFNGDQATAEAAQEHLAANLDQVIEGLAFVDALEWLRDLQATDPDRALAIYRRIQPELFHGTPEVGTWNHGTALSLAYLKLQIGEDDEAHDLARAVLRVTETTIDRYNYATSPAVAYLILGDEDRAMAMLDQAVRSGGYRFIWGHLETDPIYEPLRSRHDFQSLLEYIQSDAAAQLEQLRMWEASEDQTLVLDFTS